MNMLTILRPRSNGDVFTVWKVSRHEVFFGPYLDTFHAVFSDGRCHVM